MNREKLTPEKAVDRFLESLAEPGASRAEVDRSADRMLRCLEAEYEKLPVQRLPAWDGDRRRQGLRWVAVAAVAMALAAGLMLLRVDTGSIATVEAGTITAFDKDNPRVVTQGETLGAYQSLRVGEGNAMLSLADGSRVELSSNSDFSVVRISDGIELRLASGNAIVTAAKQKIGHLSVRTPDCTVSVTGTVFSVRAEATGSRVSVFEGQVRVVQRDRVYTLSRGEQLATSPVLGAPGLEAEVRWSPNAASVAALLQSPFSATQVSAKPAAELSRQNSPGTNALRVEGTVINQVTKEPVERVEVRFESERGLPRTVSTNAEGKFAVDDLADGRYAIKLARSGFADPELYGGTRHLSVQPYAPLKRIHLEMVTTSAISGRILDQNRQPVGSAIVHALKVQYLNGRRILSPGGLISRISYIPVGGPNPFEAPPRAKTNAMGEYRLFGLSPGEYYIAIWSKGENPQVDEPPIYYPGVADPTGAVPVFVRGGSPDMPGLDIQVPEMRAYTAQFRVVPPSSAGYDCSLLPGLRLKSFTLVQHSTNLDVVHFSGFDGDVSNENVAHMRIQKTSDNVWTTSKLALGSYEMFHSSCANAGLGLSGQLSFTIADRDVDAGTLVVPPTVRILGRVRNSSGAAVELKRLLIRLRPLDWRGFFPGSTPNPTPNGYIGVSADGMFAFELDYYSANPTPHPIFGRVAPGHFMVDLGGLPPDVYVSSIKYGAKEVRNSGMVVDSGPPGELEITLNSPGATITGTVRNTKDERVPDSSVVLVPQGSLDAPVSLSRTGATDQDGTFSIRGVPPGAYWVLASPDGVEIAAFDNPEFLKQYQSRATRVVLENASSVNVNLRLTTR